MYSPYFKEAIVQKRAKEKKVIAQDFVNNIGARVIARTSNSIGTAHRSFDLLEGEYRLLSAYSGKHILKL